MNNTPLKNAHSHIGFFQRSGYLLIGLCLLPLLVQADTGQLDQAFRPAEFDLSVSYLRMIFGTVGDQLVGGTNQLVGQIFKLLNLGLLAFAGAYISYTIVNSALGTAADSSKGLMGQAFSAWLPARMVLGSGLLLPMFNGYSTIQVIVMWAVVQGAGFASIIWDKALDKIQKTGGAMQLVPAENSQQDINALISSKIPEIYKATVCVEALAHEKKLPRQQTSNVYGVFLGSQANQANGCGKNRICFGYQTSKTSKIISSCGKLKLSLSGASSGLTLNNLQERQDVFMDEVYQVAEASYQSLRNSYQNYYEQVRNNTRYQFCAGEEFTRYNQLCPVGSTNSTCAAKLPNCAPANQLVALASQFYQGTTTLRQKACSNPDDPQACSQIDQWVDQARDGGWMTAGINYFQLIGKKNQAPVKYDPLDNYTQSIVWEVPLPSSLPTAHQLSQLTYRRITEASSRFQANALAQVRILFQSSLLGSGQDLDTGRMQGMQAILNDTMVALVPLLIPSNALQQSFSGGVFRRQSILFNFGTGAGPGTQLSLVSDNILVMLQKVLSRMVGIYPFDQTLNAGNLYGYNYGMNNPVLLGSQKPALTLTANSACTDLMNICQSSDPAVKSTCFNIAYQQVVNRLADPNAKSCLTPGAGILGTFAATLAGLEVDPILGLADLGTTMLSAATNYWIYTMNGVYMIGKYLLGQYQGLMVGAGVLGGAAVALASAAGGAADVFRGIFGWVSMIWTKIIQMMYEFDLKSLTIFLPFGAAVALAFFTMGVTLGIYVPLIPMIIFMFSVIGWLISVIEAMVAAPLIALGVTHPQGHDLLGKGEQALILLVSIFLRPAAILIGFVVSILLAHISMQLLNYGFINILGQYASTTFAGETVMPLTQILGYVGLLFLYSYVCVDVVQMAFSPMYKIPENLVRWVGGQPEQFGIEASLQNVKGGLGQSANTVGQSASQAASQSTTVGSPTGVGMSFDTKKKESTSSAEEQK